MLGRRLLLSSSAAFLRAGAAFVLLIAAARFLSLSDFARFMYVYTVIAVSGVIIDYGQQLSLLRNLSLHPERERELLSRAIAGKGFLTIPYVASFCAAMVADPSLRASAGIGVVVLIGYAANSFSVLLLTPQRARLDLKPDLIVAAIDAAALCAGLALFTLGGADLIGVALAFGVSKFAACTASYFMASKPVARRADIRGWARELRDGIPYAAHLAVGMLLINVDLVIIKQLVPDSQYAIYQAGARLVHGVGFALTVINNVFLPRWARPQPSSRPHELVIVMLLGLVVLAVFPLGTDRFAIPIVQIIYGERYAALAPLIWVFAAIIVLRILGAFVGVVMTLSGRQRHRVGLGIAAVTAIVALNYLFVPDHGISATAYILLIVHLLHLCGATLLERKVLLGTTRNE